MTFNIHEVNERLMESIETLEKEALSLSGEQRAELVEQLTEEYYGLTGKFPDKWVLERMSNIILVEIIKDRTPDKLSRTEYPFLSDRQALTRMKRELSLEGSTLDFLHLKERKKMASTFKKRTQNKED